MNVIINAIVTILQVLAFGDTVCADQNIDIVVLVFRIKDIPVLGYRREAREHMIHFRLKLRNCCSSFNTAGNKSGVHSQLLYLRSNILIQILCCIRKGSENQNFPVAWVNWLFFFFLNYFQELIQLIIVFRCDILNHADEFR